MNIIKVASNSKTSAVAGAIAHSLRDSQQTDVQAIGATAVNQAVKATIMAKQFLAEEGRFITFSPGFVKVQINGKERTAVRLSVNSAFSPPAGFFTETAVSEIRGNAPLKG
jgi:stage V sporulation protein S